MNIGSTKFLFHWLCCIQTRKSNTANELVLSQTRFKTKEGYYNLWIEKEWINAIGKKLFEKVETTYVLTTPLIKKEAAKSFLTGKHRENRVNVLNDILNAHFKTKNTDYIHFVFQEDINGRLWIIRPAVEFFLSYVDTSLFFRGLYYKDKTYTEIEKETVKVLPGTFFYDWDMNYTDEQLLIKTTNRSVQGDFVKDTRAMSLAQMSDYFKKTVVTDKGKSYIVFINMLKKYGLIHQFHKSDGTKVTMWNPTFAAEYKGHFGTFQPKTSGDKFFNIYGDGKMMGVLQRIMFEPGVFQSPNDNQLKLI